MLENRLLELVIVLLLVMLLFGAKRLPDTARALGRSLRILKSETRAMSDEARDATAGARAQVLPSEAGTPVTAPAAAAPAAEPVSARVDAEAR
jgi:sec-independent protein translocase protein TatA